MIVNFAVLCTKFNVRYFRCDRINVNPKKGSLVQSKASNKMFTTN